MGSGISVEKTQEENDGEVLVVNKDNSTVFISLHMTSISIVSSISLLAGRGRMMTTTASLRTLTMPNISDL